MSKTPNQIADRLPELKTLLHALPFADNEAGLKETGEWMAWAGGEIGVLRRDIEILMAAIDRVAYRNTIGPAMFTHIGEAGQNEIDLRIEIVDKARKSTQTWKDTDAQLDAEESALSSKDDGKTGETK